ncbi:unnamed protein product [Timema podura]|uniref:aspartate transaminase n=1 Tax=Timema podura TaxID=61482 RepID=A0ABN7NRI4_TIMPD|nr:unnamed protein product [Timema podura]
MSNRRFEHVKPVQKMEIQYLREEFRDDESEVKVDLICGVYRTEENEPWVLPVVRRVEKEMADDVTLDHEYLWFLGLDEFSQAATKLILGPQSSLLHQDRVVSIQTLSGTGAVRTGAELLARTLGYDTVYISVQSWGTGALRIGAQFLSKEMGYDTFYLSSPSWGDHEIVFRMAGFTTVLNYRYWSDVTKSLDITGLLEDLSKAHPSTDFKYFNLSWRAAQNLLGGRKRPASLERNLFPFFDTPYQGFASGDLDEDMWPVRYFAEVRGTRNHNERVGALTVVLNDSLDVETVRTRLQVIVRGTYCSPPAHGAVIALRILSDPANFQEWKSYVRVMAKRIIDVRQRFRAALEEINTPGSWEHITSQTGMFSLTGLSRDQVRYLKEKHHVYLMSSGRYNMCALNDSNIHYVASAVKDAFLSVHAEDGCIKNGV